MNDSATLIVVLLVVCCTVVIAAVIALLDRRKKDDMKIIGPFDTVEELFDSINSDDRVCNPSKCTLPKPHSPCYFQSEIAAKREREGKKA